MPKHRIELMIAVHTDEQDKISEMTNDRIPLDQCSLVPGGVFADSVNAYYQDPDYPEFIAICAAGSWFNAKMDVEQFGNLVMSYS